MAKFTMSRRFGASPDVVFDVCADLDRWADRISAITKIEKEMAWQPLTFFAKLMSPIGKLMMGSVKKMFDKDFEDIENAVEAQSAGAK